MSEDTPLYRDVRIVEFSGIEVVNRDEEPLIRVDQEIRVQVADKVFRCKVDYVSQFGDWRRWRARQIDGA